MARTKYIKTRGRKTRGRKNRSRKTMRNKIHIKKQYGGELSDECITEILKMAFKENEDLTEPQITVLVNKLITISTLWRSYPDLFALLNQIDGMVNDNLNYDQFLDWANNIVEHLINTQDIN